MHYIRFLKSPRLIPSGNRDGLSTLSAKVTVTTDLGESFLWADIALIVELVDSDGKTVITKEKEYAWKGSEGMRSLEIGIPIPASGRARQGKFMRMLVRPKEERSSVDVFESIMRHDFENVDDAGGVVAVRSMIVDFSSAQNVKKATSVPMAERVFRFGKSELHIWEETGESIARHIWYATMVLDRDAGLVLSAYLTSISLPETSSLARPKHLPQLPILRKRLSEKDLNVLELGAGCGIVGITLATHFTQISQIILTDLPEASEILTQNLSSLKPNPTPPSKQKQNISRQVLNWESPLPQTIKETKWDLVLVADCTYNPDAVPDLVKTLRSAADGNDVLVLLAMKVRHDSEMVFFELMAKEGFIVREKGKIPLPVLGGEGEEIEVFVFGLK